MGIIDSVKGLVSGEEDESHEDIAKEFSDEIEMEEGSSPGEDMEIDDGEDEDIQEVWDTAYQFCFDMIEEDGFANMQEFIGKLMYYEVSKSELYRDRLQHGAETIDMVTNSVDKLNDVKNGGGNSDFEELADQLQAADRAIKAADSLSGKDDAMEQDLINLGYEAIDTLGSTVKETRTGNIDSSVTESDEEM